MQAILQHFGQILSRVILALNSHIVVVAGYFAAKKKEDKKDGQTKDKMYQGGRPRPKAQDMCSHS